jgi:TonB family protein
VRALPPPDAPEKKSERRLPSISRGVLAFTASVTLHASAAGVIRYASEPLELAPRVSKAVPIAAPELAVDVEPPRDEERVIPAQRETTASRPRGVAMTPARPSQSLTNPRPSSASTSDERAASAETAARVEASPVRFVIPNAVAATTPATTGPQAPSARGKTPLPENRVTVPARLVARVSVVYPPAARAGEIETDVRLELVVDASGHVATARCLRSVGYGLDEAALTAVRAYRFSPALLDGHPVGVRMQWVVQFRLN